MENYFNAFEGRLNILSRLKGRFIVYDACGMFSFFFRFSRNMGVYLNIHYNALRKCNIYKNLSVYNTFNIYRHNFSDCYRKCQKSEFFILKKKSMKLMDTLGCCMHAGNIFSWAHIKEVSVRGSKIRNYGMLCSVELYLHQYTAYDCSKVYNTCNILSF